MSDKRAVKRLLAEVAQNLKELAEIQAALSYNHQTIMQEFARRIELLAETDLNGKMSLDALPSHAPERTIMS